MKIITLNTWGGTMHAELMDFVARHKDTDVFCFQEILRGGKGTTNRGESKSCYEDISNLLPEHNGYFSEYGKGGYFSEDSKELDFAYGIACFVKKKYEQSYLEGITLYDNTKQWGDYDGKLAAGAAISLAISNYIVVNVHGLWQGGMKRDSQARIEQSQRIIELANKFPGKKILCGDFNLEPDTKSIKMFEDLPLRNLINDYRVTSTRTSLYTKKIRFADYMFVDDGIDVLDFKVGTRVPN